MARHGAYSRSPVAPERAAVAVGPLAASVAKVGLTVAVVLASTTMLVVAFASAPANAAENASVATQAGELARGALALLGSLPPVAFFGAMAILCVLPVPVSAFYVGGAALYGTVPTLAWLPFAIAGNVWLAQTLAARGLRPLAARVLAARGLRVPTLRAGDALPFTVLVRMAPGVPFFAQNLLLGLAEVDRLRSIAVALPIQLAFASGFILLGRSAFEGRLGTLVLSLGLIASVSIAARLAHRRLAARSSAEPAER